MPGRPELYQGTFVVPSPGDYSLEVRNLRTKLRVLDVSAAWAGPEPASRDPRPAPVLFRELDAVGVGAWATETRWAPRDCALAAPSGG